MGHFVYILQSLKDFTYYKGYTQNLEKRLASHNNGESKYTSRKTPWKIVYYQELSSKTEALVRERQLKRVNMNYLKLIIEQFAEKQIG